MTDKIIPFLSSQRFATYRLPGESDAQAFARYQWNIRLAEALVPAFNYFEVGLRNGINNAIANLFGQDWLLTKPNGLYLSQGSIEKIQEAKDEFLKIKHRPATHGDVLANLSFGFWAGFFHNRHAPVLWNRPKKTWPVIFPNLPAAQWQWQNIKAKVFEVKDLRNRIAHHEPIWNSNPPVDVVHQTCIGLVRAMSIPAADALAQIDRLPEVWKQKV